VSLSFDPAEFSYITGPDSPSYGLLRMWSVFYSNATQRNIVGEALDFGAQTGASLEQRVARAPTRSASSSPPSRTSCSPKRRKCA
jgi:hypothetical protein